MTLLSRLAGVARFAHLIGPTTGRQVEKRERDRGPDPAPPLGAWEREKRAQAAAGKPVRGLPIAGGWAEEKAAHAAAGRAARAAARRRAAARDVEDDDPAELRGDGPLAAARDEERRRCAAIMLSAEGRADPPLAAALALRCDMPAEAARAFMARQGGA